MKKTISACIFTSIFLLACNSNPKKSEFTINMHLIGGLSKVGIYDLPSDCQLTVSTSQGSYWLEYYTEDCNGSDCFGRIKSGVIDYEIISKKPIQNQ